MESQHDIVLNDVSNYLGRNEDEVQRSEDLTGHNEFSLPQADGGKDAWLFLMAGFMIEALVWGQSVSSKHQESTTLTDFRPSLLFRRLSGILQYS